MKKILSIITIIALFTACDDDTIQEQSNTDVLTQISVLDALVQGIYDGTYPIGDLKQFGDYGIGTFHGLNGEMVMCNDTIYQVLSTGEVKIPSDTVKTPFAMVAPLEVDLTHQLQGVSFDSLKNGFDTFFPTANIFYAIKIEGAFSFVKTRSVPGQTKPYPPLVEVTANQPEFEFENTRGTIIGFYCPQYASGINLPGLHLHFLNSTRTGGGHLLEMQIEQATMQVDFLFDYNLVLPKGGDFFGGDFDTDWSDDLHEAEN